MKTFLEAYRERMVKNDAFFRLIAADFKAAGCIVTAYNPDTKLINGITIYKDGKHIHFYFSEVPYKFTLGISWEPNRNTGSGRTIETHYNIDGDIYENNPWSVQYIIDKMAPDYKSQHKFSVGTEI